MDLKKLQASQEDHFDKQLVICSMNPCTSASLQFAHFLIAQYYIPLDGGTLRGETIN
jgi:hypothetical protein